MLATDTQLGPYRLIAPIGAGGMGEVYRAVDTRLGREVAVKVLSSHLTHDVEATRRFEQEARAAGMLNHPNILAIYDIGVEGELRFIVSELLEGESLRARMRSGTLSPRKTAEIAAQLARGLAAAHDRGIIHRDLKPENVFLTRDGIVKILDFGLVKLMRPLFPSNVPADENAPTLHGSPTEPGRVIGTVGYMSPEQIRGESGDHRSDVFAFGAIVYEMLAGRPAFHADSPVETLNAILKDDPPDLIELGVRAPGALDRIVRHCLEKNPDDRFQSARDLAFDIGAMSGLTSQSVGRLHLPRVNRRVLALRTLAILAAAAALAAAFGVGTRFGHRPPATFKRLSYRNGTILSARFSPDGASVFYGARWGGAPSSIYSSRRDSPESRDLGFGSAEILDVSSTGQLAIQLRPRFIGYLRQAGTLAQVPIAGGAPRPLLDEVEAAEWSPDGNALAIVRTVEGKCRLEYPIGTVLYSTIGWISSPRFDAKGRAIAFADHPFPNDDRGVVTLIDVTTRERRALTPEFESIEGVAWSGNDVYFAAHRMDVGRTLNAVNQRGRITTLASSAGWLRLHDVAPNGDVLVSQQDMRAGIMAMLPDEPHERDLSWLDYSVIRDISRDGRTMLFSESGEAGGAEFGVYVRGIDGSPAIRLGEGTSEALSPDGKWVLSIQRNRNPAQIVILPTGVGEPRPVTSDRLVHRAARWFNDGKRILFQAVEPGRGPRLWVQRLGEASPRAITEENVNGYLVTPDDQRVLGRDASRRFFFYPVAGGTPTLVNALQPHDVPIRFGDDASTVFVASFGRIPAVLTKVNLVTGERTVWREAAPADRSGVINVGPIYITPDGRTAVYSYTRLLSSLYVTTVR